MTEVVVTTGAIRRAKLQSNHQHQHTNTQIFTGQIPFLPHSIELKTRSCSELTSRCHFRSIGCLCVQFKVVVYTSVNSLSRKCLAVVHQCISR